MIFISTISKLNDELLLHFALGNTLPYQNTLMSTHFFQGCRNLVVCKQHSMCFLAKHRIKEES